VEYEWDADKEAKNYGTHGVNFADAVGVFEDERALTESDTTTLFTRGDDHEKIRGVQPGKARRGSCDTERQDTDHDSYRR
jgi:uncharacterized DUF497 family protein